MCMTDKAERFYALKMIKSIVNGNESISMETKTQGISHLEAAIYIKSGWKP